MVLFQFDGWYIVMLWIVVVDLCNLIVFICVVFDVEGGFCIGLFVEIWIGCCCGDWWCRWFVWFDVGVFVWVCLGY